MRSGFLPQTALLETVDDRVRDNHLFTFRVEKELGVAPGQFVELSVPGIGAFPVSSCAYQTGTALVCCIRRAGRVTDALYRLATGDRLGVRGPFGAGFPLEAFFGRDALLVAGGLGMAPLRGLLHALLSQRERFGEIILLYGSRDPESLLFRDELETLGRSGAVQVRFSVDFATELPWASDTFFCRVGLVTSLLEKLPLTPGRTTAAVCGPPSLYGCVLEELSRLGIPDETIFATLERRMRCGVGECCHCVAGGVFVCCEGPVFSLARLRQLPGAF
jgi:NAD(P)H-flavin reductase